MRIDLNADVGEGLDDVDAALIPLVTSASIGCGGHAGDEATMGRAVDLALRHGVSIGAHPGFPDREGFGRRRMDMTAPDLQATIVEQLESLGRVVVKAGAAIRHVKPHGALYNAAARRDPARQATRRAVQRRSDRCRSGGGHRGGRALVLPGARPRGPGGLPPSERGP